MTDTPVPPPDDELLPNDNFGEQKEQVDAWLDEEKAEREEKERRQSEP